MTSIPLPPEASIHSSHFYLLFGEALRIDVFSFDSVGRFTLYSPNQLRLLPLTASVLDLGEGVLYADGCAGLLQPTGTNELRCAVLRLHPFAVMFQLLKLLKLCLCQD